jgi:hypothetical protein
MRKLLITAAMAVAAVTAVPLSAAEVGTAGASTASTPYCGITWGSLTKSDPAMTTAPITNLRAGRHECFDRLVVDLGAPVAGTPAQHAGYRVAYVSQVVQDGSGRPVPLAGGAFLSVVVHAPAYNVVTGSATYRPADPAHAVNVAGFSTFRQVAFAGSFEGYTTIGLGVRARLPFRVFLLAGPGTGSRLVVDVAHRWS